MQIHFISIGGSVMHQLAIALKLKGYQITGSDDEIFEPARTNLEREDILPPIIGWYPERVNPSLDAVILGMHAKEDNPELHRAKELTIPIYSFPEYIYKESIDKTRVVVGGSHGKTTTTSMIMHVLKEAEKEFDYLVGAILNGFDLSVRITNAPLIICEGDEYPASTLVKSPKFHFLFPHIAVLTGIAWDHINVFATFEIYLEQFRAFLDKIKSGGHLIYNETDETLVKLIQQQHRDDISYHPYNIPEHSISSGITTLSIEGSKTELKVFGNHNLLNIHAAWHVCKQLNISARQFVQAIGSFSGASKRLELLAGNNQTLVYRDFAHAPTKAKATIEAVKSQYPNKTLIAVFELHTYSSLSESFIQEYKGVFEQADIASVFYSFHALEIKRLPMLQKEEVKKGFAYQSIEVFNKKEELEQWLNRLNYQDSVVLFMSSGNFDGMNLENLAKKIALTTV
jgi:UDP-N-acetylmuramate: L-alanyl-gamma-D-glutamyl-meso-diaminopimelate ligase